MIIIIVEVAINLQMSGLLFEHTRMISSIPYFHALSIRRLVGLLRIFAEKTNKITIQKKPLLQIGGFALKTAKQIISKKSLLLSE